MTAALRAFGRPDQRGTARPPSRQAEAVAAWNRHVAAGERAAELLEAMECAANAPDRQATMVELLDELRDAIAEADLAAWHAVKALDRRG